MDHIFNAEWIKAPRYRKDAALVFLKTFQTEHVKSAELMITARGVYHCEINKTPVGDYVLAPGWTDYYHRLQYQTYDVTSLLSGKNCIEIRVGRGWYFHNWYDKEKKLIRPDEPAVLASLQLTYENGTTETIRTDASWRMRTDEVTYNHIYNGETADLAAKKKPLVNAAVVALSKDLLIPQEGEKITEHERFPGVKLLRTPKGEQVIDFGQEITGYVEFTARGKKGTPVRIRHFEMLDRDGNVYTENYRSAKSEFTVICGFGARKIKPRFTFYGFRYIAVEGIEAADPADFTAIAVYSDMKRTGRFSCSDPMINRLYENIVWGQKGNFLDVPTDCPQRDERLGWTGDAQVFCKIASYNFDTERFFGKWLGDLRTTQNADGRIPNFVPCRESEGGGSAAWADVSVIVPWQMYLTYGNKKILQENFPMMEKWVRYMINAAKKEKAGKNFDKNRNIYLHNDHWHFGDWLALDLPDKEAVGGATDKDLIATAFFAYSTSLLIKAGEVLGRDMREYKELYGHIRDAFREEYVRPDGSLTSDTQTAAVLALQFGLTDDREAAAKQLVRLIRACGHLTTGFVGTPYLLHVLSDIGETKLAYDLLLRDEFPSWCYPITKGATTMWERWNGMKPDGTFATKSMNSFNHYAYGAVGDWMTEHMAGIVLPEDGAGYRKVRFAPETDSRFDFVEASVDTRAGTVASRWEKTENGFLFTFTVPENTGAEAVIGGKLYTLHTGINEIAG